MHTHLSLALLGLPLLARVKLLLQDCDPMHLHSLAPHLLGVVEAEAAAAPEPGLLHIEVGKVVAVRTEQGMCELADVCVRLRMSGYG